MELYNFIHDVADKLLLQGNFAFKAKTLSAKFETEALNFPLK